MKVNRLIIAAISYSKFPENFSFIPMTQNNKLSQETSPYLLQHSNNPVDWYPWGEEALKKAHDENKPILLSVGYSACHWCHVMAHESFEDESTAEIMNKLFVNIKVDREERPDIDKIYQTAHQLITQRPGGWPLTVFLTPEKQLPFFAGTYFPNEERYGMPAFADLLIQIAQYFNQKQDDAIKQGHSVIKALTKIEPSKKGISSPINYEPLKKLRDQLAANFDKDCGGFGSAPKFPNTTNLEFLLRCWRKSANDETPDTEALFMCAMTLTRMMNGGIYDHLGGGFYRYSVDREWSIPHFEKMLYDNGPLLGLLAQLWQVSGENTYKNIANETANWVLNEMENPEGGFYSSLDADSEGKEGEFYVWTPDEIEPLLSKNEYEVFSDLYGLSKKPNFESYWHLQHRNSVEISNEKEKLSVTKKTTLLKSARKKLLTIRSARIRPDCDKKILTSWNSLMIRGLAISGRILKSDEFINAAERAIKLIKEKAIIEGRLRASFKDGRARFNAYLDDHAFLLDALIELLQARWNNAQIELAIKIADDLIENFQDEEHGGFFFKSKDHEKLAHRSKTFSDDSLPSGNAIAAYALSRLGHLIGETRYLIAAEKTLQAGWLSMLDFPHGHAAMAISVEEYLNPPEIVIVRGNKTEAESWAEEIGSIYAPGRLIFAIPSDEGKLPGSLSKRPARNGTTAYICRGTSCSPPIQNLSNLALELSEA
ncbi:MAG: thioredoxin domain-containing protein [Pseudomonadota bacterium]|nr:thioredoxin domain-containing protein [Pseudomonadota bacterium]